MECLIENLNAQHALNDLDKVQSGIFVNKINLDGEQNGVFSKRLITKGTAIMQIRLIENLLIDKPTKYTIQVKENIHLNCELYDWIMYLNHKCDANMQIKLTDDILTFLAAKDINPNEEITFNYLTTEYEMANSFVCNCNSGKCYKEIKGFRYLSEQDKYSLLPFIISYLKEKLEIKEINIL